MNFHDDKLGWGRDASGLFGNAAKAPGWGWHSLRQDAAATGCKAGSTPWRRNGRAGWRQRKQLRSCQERGLREGGGKGIRQRGDDRREKVVEQFRSSRWERGFLVFLTRFFGFRLGDLLAKVAGLLAGEGVGDGLREGAFLRVADQHVRPCIHLQDRVGAADQMEAAEDQEQVA